jgi:hypothetical protein
MPDLNFNINKNCNKTLKQQMRRLSICSVLFLKVIAAGFEMKNAIFCICFQADHEHETSIVRRQFYRLFSQDEGAEEKRRLPAHVPSKESLQHFPFPLLVYAPRCVQVHILMYCCCKAAYRQGSL